MPSYLTCREYAESTAEGMYILRCYAADVAEFERQAIHATIDASYDEALAFLRASEVRRDGAFTDLISEIHKKPGAICQAEHETAESNAQEWK